MRLIAEKIGKFRISWDEERASVEFEIRGFWSDHDMREFLPLAKISVARSHDRHGDARVLIDLTNTGVMSGSLFGDFFTGGPKPMLPTASVAIVVASMIQKLQMKRIAAGDKNTEFFVIREEADIWLHNGIAAEGPLSTTSTEVIEM